jgi:DNA repair ATPase RecN
MEHTIDKQKMEAIKALSDTNMKISEAKNALSKLQETEKEYIKEREARVLKQIQQNLKDSEDIIAKTNSNYVKVQDLYKIVCGFVDYINETLTVLEETVSSFDKVSSKFESEVKEQEIEIESIKKTLKLDTVQIQNDKKSLIAKEKRLDDIKKHLESRQSALEKAYKVDKNLWEKIQQKN